MSRNHKISLLDTHPDCVWEDENARTVSYFCKIKPVLVGQGLIKDLKVIARENHGKNVRFCLHEGPEAVQHDMVVLEHQGVYGRPHKHPEKEDVYHIMEGQMAVVLFDNNGSVTNADVLCPRDIYRIGLNVYHAVVPLTSEVIYHENKPGPFLRESDAVYPGWAPDGSDTAAAADYIKRLLIHMEVTQVAVDQGTSVS